MFEFVLNPIPTGLRQSVARRERRSDVSEIFTLRPRPCCCRRRKSGDEHARSTFSGWASLPSSFLAENAVDRHGQRRALEMQCASRNVPFWRAVRLEDGVALSENCPPSAPPARPFPALHHPAFPSLFVGLSSPSPFPGLLGRPSPSYHPH
uniref:Uncharacterized protein n=1 Tax=Globodera rostochiensis TaxID=31243 RepID=A0A914HW14_GLORO